MNIDICFVWQDGRVIAAEAQAAHLENVPDDCTAWAEKVARAALQAVRGIPFERNPPKGLTAAEFREKYIVVQCEKCCATCRHGVDLMDYGCYQCKHPSIKDGVQVFTTMSDVCVAWEKNGCAK